MTRSATELLAELERHHAEQAKLIAELRALMAPAPTSLGAAEEWLTPQQLAGREGITEGHARKVLKLGRELGIAGVRKDGGRWSATAAGFTDARNRCAF